MTIVQTGSISYNLQFVIYSFSYKPDEEKPQSLLSCCNQFTQKLKLVRGQNCFITTSNTPSHVEDSIRCFAQRRQHAWEVLMLTPRLTWYQQNFQDVLSSNLTIGDLSKYLFNPIILYAVHHSARSLSTWHQRQEGVLSCLIYISGTQPISLNFWCACMISIPCGQLYKSFTFFPIQFP